MFSQACHFCECLTTFLYHFFLLNLTLSTSVSKYSRKVSYVQWQIKEFWQVYAESAVYAPYYSVQFSVLTIQVEAEGEQRGADPQHHQQRQHRAAAAGKQRVNTLNRLNN